MKLFQALQLLLFPTTEQKAIAQRIKKLKTLKVGSGVLISVDPQEIWQDRGNKK
jgi:hypothetical protein